MQNKTKHFCGYGLLAKFNQADTVKRCMRLRPLLVMGVVVCVCELCWETGEWPEEWTWITFIPLPKKVILNSVQITEQLLLSYMQATSYYGSH